MTLAMKFDELHKEGFAEGRAKGIKQNESKI